MRCFIANIFSRTANADYSDSWFNRKPICDGIISNPEQLKDYNEQILSDSIHLQRLVNDWIDLTKLQNTDFSIDKSTINLFEIINDAVRKMKQISTKKRCENKFFC